MNTRSDVTVLLVEDETLIRLDLASYLEQRGFKVIEAGSADEAIQILERDNTIRVVFTDVRMPGDMDGVALAKCVRERWPPTIIVVCSGNLEEAVDVADIHILEKPYFADQVFMILDAVEQQLQAT
jgi:DNA-binding NtrC family response regulator